MEFSPDRPAFFINPSYLPMGGASRAVVDPATLETAGTIAEASEAATVQHIKRTGKLYGMMCTETP